MIEKFTVDSLWIDDKEKKLVSGYIHRMENNLQIKPVGSLILMTVMAFYCHINQIKTNSVTIALLDDEDDSDLEEMRIRGITEHHTHDTIEPGYYDDGHNVKWCCLVNILKLVLIASIGGIFVCILGEAWAFIAIPALGTILSCIGFGYVVCTKNVYCLCVVD